MSRSFTLRVTTVVTVEAASEGDANEIAIRAVQSTTEPRTGIVVIDTEIVSEVAS